MNETKQIETRLYTEYFNRVFKEEDRDLMTGLLDDILTWQKHGIRLDESSIKAPDEEIEAEFAVLPFHKKIAHCRELISETAAIYLQSYRDACYTLIKQRTGISRFIVEHWMLFHSPGPWKFEDNGKLASSTH